MFGKDKDKLNKMIDVYAAELKEYKDIATKLTDRYNHEKLLTSQAYEVKIQKLTSTHESETQKLQDQLTREKTVGDIKVAAETKKLSEDLTASKIENGKLKAENEIYAKAFTGLGMDVKDLKEVMGKLADALATKNTVQVIK